MARSNKRKKGNTVSVDMTDVEVRVLIPEGVYDAVVEEVKLEEGQKGEYLAWKFKTVDDDPKLNDKSLYNNTSLAPQSLWVLATLLDTLGVERPSGPMDLNLDELIGLEIGLVVEHEEYEGKNRAKVVDFTPAGEGDDDEEVETINDSDGGGETYTEDEINEMDLDELKAIIEGNELEVKLVKKLATNRQKVIDALAEDGLIDDGEDGADGEEGEEGQYTEEEVNEMDLDELKEVVEENELKVKFVKKLSANRANVIAALEKAGLIGEEEEGDEEDLYTEDEINEMDNKGLQKVVDEEELDVKLGKNLKRNRKAVIEALEEAELMEDGEEE